MSQNSVILPTSGTVSGLQMTEYTNAALDTLNTLASGPSAPSSAEAGQLWHDTTNNMVKIRSLDNTSWIILFNLNEVSYVAAPPFTGNANRILNGAMVVDQINQGSSYSITTNGNNYTLDQWRIDLQSGSFSGVSAQRVSDAPAGFAQSLKVTVATATSSLVSTDSLAIAQPIEGFNIGDWNWGTSNAAPCSLSFWIKSSVAGTFAVSLQNSANNRSYVSNFTVTTANVWQQINIANISGDISGTWNNTNGTGLIVAITIAAGTGVQTSTLGTWQNGTLLASNSQNNGVVLTSGSTFQLTGMVLNKGVFCAPFEGRLYSSELACLQRYLEVINLTTNYQPGTSVAGWNSYPFHVPKRAVPTMKFTSMSYYSGGSGTPFTPNISGANTDSFYVGSNSGITNFSGIQAGTVIASAEL